MSLTRTPTMPRTLSTMSMEPARYMSCDTSARSSSGPVVGRLSTTAVIVVPEIRAGKLYPPVLIDDRYYVDGVLLKTLHASVGLDAGAELLICVNPIVPVDTRAAVEQGIMRRGKLIHRGWPSVLSQTFRTLIHSRLEVGLACYGNRYDGAELAQPVPVNVRTGV